MKALVAISRLWAHPVATFFSVFPLLLTAVLVIVAFAYVEEISRWGPFANLPLKGFLTVIIILGSGYVLTVVGTFTYLVDLSIWAWRRLPGASGFLFGTALCLCIVAIILLIYSPLSFVLSGIDLARPEGMLHLQHHNDMLLLRVFLLFLLIDMLMAINSWKACKALLAADQEYAKGHAEAFHHNRAFEKFSVNQMWLIDIPVLVLIGVNMFLGSFLEHNTILNEVNLRRIGLLRSSSDATSTISKALIAGISCGLLGAHIIFSQIIFLALKLREIASDEGPPAAGSSHASGNDGGKLPPPPAPQPPPTAPVAPAVPPTAVPRKQRKHRRRG